MPSSDRRSMLSTLRRSFDQSLLERPVTAPPFWSDPPVERVVERDLDRRSTAGWQRRFVGTLLLADLVTAALVAAAVLALSSGAPLGVHLATAALPLVWVAACAAMRAYEPRFLGTGSEEYRRVFDAGVRLLALAAVLSLAGDVDGTRTHVLAGIPLTVLLTLVSRYSLRQWLHRRRAAGECLHKVVVVGRERSCAELIRQLRTSTHSGFSVVGACLDRPQVRQVEGVPVVGSSSTIVDALQLTGADTVAVGAWSDLTQSDLRRLSWQLEGSGVALVVAPSLTDVAGPRIHIRPVAGLPLLHVEEPELSGGRRLLKETVDRVGALVTLVLLLPLLLALALAVRLSSPGPAFFRQERVGVAGSTFTIIKLRSMYVDAEARLEALRHRNEVVDGPLFKIRDDPRVTPVGRFLRRTSLDELPQLLNIIKGDMSIVGPRPPLPSEVARYGSDVRRRLLVKPGLTGLWQISGRSDLSWSESVRLDLLYVENWSLALDAMIVWKTLFAVARREGAY